MFLFVRNELFLYFVTLVPENIIFRKVRNTSIHITYQVVIINTRAGKNPV